MTATVRITDEGASVDGRLVEVPAGIDPVRCCLDSVCRDESPVRALIVDERDGWEYRVLVHPDGRVEEDPDPPPAARDATVRVAARRWRVGPVAAVVAVLAAAGWLAVDAARTGPPSSSPGSTELQGTVALTVPPAGTTTPALLPTASPAPVPAPATTTTTTSRAAPTTGSAPRRTTRPSPRPTARTPATTRPPATATRPAPPPPVVGGAVVARTVVDELRAGGAQVNRVTCPALPAQLGATRRCTLVSDFGVFGVTVSVSRVRDTDVEFDITVDQRPR
ncbi:hypothetical protein [Pseudonocardia charpentierae]|uniref:DUF4333 domain-containing protein n=1 Tax=Pseudonocardia charpentierae TaxID=3075545 RepID=A0ABU2NLP8_9PSEU|nr:hypothetical protein [Pseudonocardia sp. DSM 45834]MDT0353963.1 hypothetical protein [Pseudonocardia sp. DSM 45834]